MAFNIESAEQLLSSLRRVATNFGKARAFQYLDITDNAVHTLTVPSNCQYAIVSITTGTPSTTTPVAWYRMDGGAAGVNAGLPVFGQLIVDVSDYENLSKFSIKGTTGGEKVYIQYFNLQY
jgi:hypothetical protein